MTTILQKLKIAAPHVICTLNAPDDFAAMLGKLPKGVSIITDTKEVFDTLHWFVKTKAEVDKQSPKIIKLLKPGVQVWCYYPKGTSKVQTDLTRDKGWNELLKYEQLKWINLISFNETWSAFAFRLKSEKDKAVVPREREILKYADSKTKIITLPDDFAKALAKNKKAKTVFDTLAFSHRREYVEWIVTAKREETRLSRVEGTISKLLEGKKNPAEK
jgi:hypothetical protein